MGKRLTTRTAPGSPDIDKNNFAGISVGYLFKGTHTIGVQYMNVFGKLLVVECDIFLYRFFQCRSQRATQMQFLKLFI